MIHTTLLHDGQGWSGGLPGPFRGPSEDCIQLLCKLVLSVKRSSRHGLCRLPQPQCARHGTGITHTVLSVSCYVCCPAKCSSHLSGSLRTLLSSLRSILDRTPLFERLARGDEGVHHRRRTDLSPTVVLQRPHRRTKRTPHFSTRGLGGTAEGPSKRLGSYVVECSTGTTHAGTHRGTESNSHLPRVIQGVAGDVSKHLLRTLPQGYTTVTVTDLKVQLRQKRLVGHHRLAPPDDSGLNLLSKWSLFHIPLHLRRLFGSEDSGGDWGLGRGINNTHRRAHRHPARGGGGCTQQLQHRLSIAWGQLQ
eukprot:Hpha_TRINITY_DN23481_c0_g1::TRINITY_DN23481_c0_g1_i1::g.114078::m.114078